MLSSAMPALPPSAIKHGDPQRENISLEGLNWECWQHNVKNKFSFFYVSTINIVLSQRAAHTLMTDWYLSMISEPQIMTGPLLYMKANGNFKTHKKGKEFMQHVSVCLTDAKLCNMSSLTQSEDISLHFQPLQYILFAAVVQCISYMADRRIKIQHVGFQHSLTKWSNEVRNFYSTRSLSGFSRQYEVKDPFYQLLYLLNTSFPQSHHPKKMTSLSPNPLYGAAMSAEL